MEALRRFATGALASASLEIEPASADASFRSYWRVCGAGSRARIVMDAPPDKENLGPWLDIGARLRRSGLHVPEVFAVDRGHGFVLMEDLGTRTYLPELTATSADALYADALGALTDMQTHADANGLPAYDRALLVSELERMPEWFLGHHLGFAPSCDEWDIVEAAFTFLINSALEQPQAFVHRDFHSRNLLIVDADARTDDGKLRQNPGIIDFQDAVRGPVTYDLVSLLRDCYVEWDAARVDAWMESQRERLRHARVIDTAVGHERFRRWFDLIGLQRHLKVLGNFSRLWYRDGKPQYLADMPLVWRYVTTVARAYPQLDAFVDLLERACDGRDLTRPRTSVAT
jgi:aminoglycoside/choline kinase family phosphotransferase